MCIRDRPVFVQVLLNTDNDSLMLLIISNFITLQIQHVELEKVEHPLWDIIYKRFGGNSQILVMKINTLLTSYEFHLFLQYLLDDEIN